MFFFSFHKSLQGYTEEMIKKECQPRKPRGMKTQPKESYENEFNERFFNYEQKVHVGKNFLNDVELQRNNKG